MYNNTHHGPFFLWLIFFDVWYSGGMKKRFLYIILGLIAAMSAVAWFWSNISPVVQNQDVIQTEDVVSREAEKVAEPEKKATEDKPIELQAVAAKIPKSSLIEDVPFTVQAPFGEWDDPIFQNGCEEAALVMASHWLSGKPLSPEIAKQEIAPLSEYEKKQLGHSVDTSAEDTLKLFRDYYGIASGEVHTGIVLADIRESLASGSIVIVPADGRKLQNQHFTQPGPPRHMLVIIGYDAAKKQFITNDPGTKHGKGYRYPENILYDAILDYPTGDHLPVRSARKVMIAIGRL